MNKEKKKHQQSLNFERTDRLDVWEKVLKEPEE